MGSQLVSEKWSWVEAMNGMREALLEVLADADLAFKPGGQNSSLGALLREMGELQHAYTESLTTLKTDFNYRNKSAGLEGSVAKLKTWFNEMDERFKAGLEAIPDANKPMIGRPSGDSIPVEMQIDIYLQALFIVFGKLVVYFKAMSRPLPPMVAEYIG